ncbi:MAG: T9SS type A sorting domain-containing protein, partial [Prolixibacteraceae bacterium]|nr:T9SS type A sorting domain-containing protein [Prolixibacteraceae bacterium]
IDKLLIANTGIIPDGFGADATNCIPDDNNDDDNDDQNSIFETKQSNAVKIYPNPAHSAVSIISKIAFSQLTVFDNSGRKIFVKNYQNEVYSDELELNIPEGIYTIQLQGKNNVMNAKLATINHF